MKRADVCLDVEFLSFDVKTRTLVRLERRLDDSEKRKVRDGGSCSERGKKAWSQSEEWKQLRKLQRRTFLVYFTLKVIYSQLLLISN